MQETPSPVRSASYAVITADVVGSRQIPRFREKRDEALQAASKAHLRQGLILSPYTITVWDEFQTIVAAPEQFPGVALDLRGQLYPMQLRIAVGIGQVSEAEKIPLNQFAGGEAFERARSAMERLKAAKGNSMTAVESGDLLVDLATYAVYLLQDTLTAGLSRAQWNAIIQVARLGSQEKAAKQLDVNISTVSRALQRAHYREMEESSKALAGLLRLRYPVAP